MKKNFKSKKLWRNSENILFTQIVITLIVTTTCIGLLEKTIVTSICVGLLEKNCMGWLRLVGSLKLEVSFAKEPC